MFSNIGSLNNSSPSTQSSRSTQRSNTAKNQHPIISIETSKKNPNIRSKIEDAYDDYKNVEDAYDDYKNALLALNKEKKSPPCSVILISNSDSKNKLEVAVAKAQARLIELYDGNAHLQQAIKESNGEYGIGTAEGSYEAIRNAFLKEPAPIEHQGLYNSGADCYLNSALQSLKNHISNLPQESRQALLTSIKSRYLKSLDRAKLNSYVQVCGSPLAAFLENKFDGRNRFAAAFLRQEIHRIMEELAKSGTQSSQAAAEMAKSIDPKTGESLQQCDMSEALMPLMEYVDTTRVLVKEQDTYLTGQLKNQLRTVGNEQERQQGGELIIPFGIDKKASGIDEKVSLQKVIESNFTADLSGANAVKNSDGSRHDIRRKRFLENPPASMTILLNRFNISAPNGGNSVAEKLQTPICHIVDEVNFPTYSNEGTITTTYTPTSITCHDGGTSVNSGHYTTYLKKGNEWYYANGTEIKHIF